MNSSRFLKASLSVLLGLNLVMITGLAEEASPVERVGMTEGKMWVKQQGQPSPMSRIVKLPFQIEVKTNGVYTVNQGRERRFKDGQVLGQDGMLTNPDGSVAPVYDHVAMSAGKPMVTRDGQTAPLNGPVTLGDGSKVFPDGFIQSPDGRRLRLLDGQLYRLDGKTIATKDTVLFKEGKVTVQKDGSLLSVARGRSMMMNDGTKVYGDGSVVMPDGSRKQLREGEMLTVKGVVTRR